MKNFQARNGHYERNAVVKNQVAKKRGQKTPGDCWQWKANGQFSKGDNCSFRHDVNKCAKLTQPNPSPNSFMRQNERNASRTRIPSLYKSIRLRDENLSGIRTLSWNSLAEYRDWKMKKIVWTILRILRCGISSQWKFPRYQSTSVILRSSSSTRGISMPNFEVLDARTASALNKIIHNSHFKRRISLEEQKAQKQDLSLRDRQIAYLI